MSGLILHFSGIPAAGKSSFCRYLAREHGFAHYDLECWPRGWPVAALKEVWDASPVAFVDRLRSIHEKVAIDWGFPSAAQPRVEALKSVGVRLIWFSCDFAQARRIFKERGGISLSAFDNQMRDIQAQGYPSGLDALVVNTLSRAGRFRPMANIYAELFSGM